MPDTARPAGSAIGRDGRGGRDVSDVRCGASEREERGCRSSGGSSAFSAAGFSSSPHHGDVLAEVQMPPWLRSTIGRADRRRTDAARKALEGVKAKLSPALKTTALVLEGDPAHEIARLTVGSPTLVVMSLRGGAGVWGARRGSIAYHVLTHSSTPVLTLPRRRLGGRFTARLSKAVAGALRERDRIEMAGIDALLSSASTRKRALR